MYVFLYKKQYTHWNRNSQTRMERPQLGAHRTSFDFEPAPRALETPIALELAKA